MADLRRRPDADRAQGELANSRVQRVEERDRRRTGWAAAVSSWRLSCRLPATPLPRERATLDRLRSDVEESTGLLSIISRNKLTRALFRLMEVEVSMQRYLKEKLGYSTPQVRIPEARSSSPTCPSCATSSCTSWRGARSWESEARA